MATTFGSAQQILQTTRFDAKMRPPIDKALLQANESAEKAMDAKNLLTNPQRHTSPALISVDNLEREATGTHNFRLDRPDLLNLLQSTCDAFDKALDFANELLNQATATRDAITSTPDVWGHVLND